MDLIEKGKIVVDVFKEGAKQPLKNDLTWGFATVMGIFQGLKYKGDFKKGVTTSVAIIASLAFSQGVATVVTNWDTIKQRINGG